MGVYGGPSIITGGLVMFLDAANSRSYISGSNIWYDLINNNNFNIGNNGMTWDSSGVFNLYNGVGMSCDKIITASTGCTFQFWIKTSDLQALFWGGQDIPYYLGAYRVGSKEYYNLFGSPSFYLDTVEVSNIYDYLPDNKWHMVEFKNVDMSLITSNYFNNYSGYNFDSGSISMIFLYNRNITQSESKQNYNSYKARFNL